MSSTDITPAPGPIGILPGESPEEISAPMPTLYDQRYTQSEAIDQVIAAIGRAWARFPKIPRSAVGKVWKDGKHLYDWKYATLDDVYDAVKPELVAESLVITHRILQIPDDPRSYLFTQIWHIPSMQWFGQWQSISDASSAQQFGSQLTYKMRYGTCAILAVVPADDDDANTAAGQNFVPDDQGKPRQDPPANNPPAGKPGQPPEPPAAEKTDPPASAKVSTRYPPPPRKALEERIEKLASPQEVVDFADHCIGYDAISQNPSTWPFVAVALFRHIQAGVDAGGWNEIEANEAADHVRGIWPELAASAVDKFNTADQLLEWIIELGRKPPRNPGQWRQIVLLVGNTAAKKLEAGWTPATCESIGTECAKQSRRIKAQLEELTKTQETQTDGRDQSDNQENTAENGQEENGQGG